LSGERHPEVLVVMFLRETRVAQSGIARAGGPWPEEGDVEDGEETADLQKGEEDTNTWG